MSTNAHLSAGRAQWYATALPWRPQIALLPVLMPLALAVTLPARTGHMHDYGVATTANRSVVGVLAAFLHTVTSTRRSSCRQH